MFKGCLVALVTPFRDGKVDRQAIERLVDHVVDGGVSGIVACGTTGESPTLSAEERREVVAAVVGSVRGRVPVVAGTGTNCTARSLADSQAAVRAGADAIMLVAPYYNKPNQTGLYEHFGTIARGVEVPIILYNIPGRTGVEISVETIARLHADYKNIVAVKHATGSIDGASALAVASDMAIISGDDTLTVPLMSVGAVGVISVLANLLPRETSSMVNAALSGDWAEAKAWHTRLFPPAWELLHLDVNPIPIKTALAMRGLIAEEFRLPLCAMDDKKKKRLASALSGFRTPAESRQLA
ncbi:MAG: 4-hydroxy-tetrahydrodipicolinate synthase [Planctomycetota bacterium]